MSLSSGRKREKQNDLGKEKEISGNVKFVSLQVQHTLNVLLLCQLDTKESTEQHTMVTEQITMSKQNEI